MIRFIRNSKASKTNNTSKYRGIRLAYKKYEAYALITRYDKNKNRIQTRYIIGSYDTEKEAVKARVRYILDML